MKLVKLSNNAIVNLDNLTHADFNSIAKILSLYFSDGDKVDNVAYFGDDAERVWAYLVDQSYVLA